jgi:hypothetical protein
VFWTRGSATWVNHADVRGFSKNRHVKRFGRNIPSACCLERSIPFSGDIRKQARESFQSALVAAIVGIVFFIYALYAAMHSGSSSVKVSVIAGALIQVIAGINFYLYANVSKQFFAFHTCLERIDRFMIANSLCENLCSSTKKDEIRSELVRMIAGASLLTFDVISGARSGAVTSSESRHSQKSSAADSPESLPDERNGA